MEKFRTCYINVHLFNLIYLNFSSSNPLISCFINFNWPINLLQIYDTCLDFKDPHANFHQYLFVDFFS